MTAVTEAVGRYRAAGWKTVPVHRPGAGPGACTCGRPDCDKPGKHPDPRHWPGGTADAAAFEGRNVGVLLGPDSGNLADVDLDCAEARRAAPHLLPATPATFGRGAAVTHHLYVLVDGAAAFARLTDPVLPGAGATVVELRWPNADDDTGVPKAAQTVFPPSLHHTGDTLAWARDGAPAAVPGADLAAAVRRVAAAVLVARYARPKERHALVLLLANLGVRAGWADDDTVVRFAAAVFAAKGDEAMLDRVRRGEGANAVADARKRLKAGKPMTGLPALHKMLDPALTAADADAVVVRVRDWLGLPDAAAPAAAGDDPWPDPIPLSRPVAVPPFPAEVLPGWVRDWAAAVATEKQVPVDLPALLALGLVGAGLARKVVARPRPGFAEPVNLFVMPVLPPGERKTQTLATALAPVRDLERELRDAARPAVAAAESDFRVAEARVKGLEAKLAKADDPDQKGRLREQLAAARDELLKVEVPPMPLLYTEDDTPDALKAEVIRQGGRLMVASTEAKCLENITLYSDRPNFDVYLKGHAGDELKTGRVSRGRAAVADPALSCLLAPQPAVLEGLAASAALKGRGFLARWAYALPESRVGRRAVGAPAVPGAVRATYHRLLRAVWETGYGVDPETGAPAARVLGFDPGADAAFRAFEAEVEPLLAPGGALGGLAGWGNKLCGLCARLAAGLHVADALGDGREWASPIGAGAVARAARLCRDYLVPHALAAFGLMGADAKLAAARRVWRWVAANRLAEFSKRDCFHAHQAHFGTVDQLQPVLDLLERHYLVRAKAAPERAGRGRKPSPVYEVNPAAGGDDGPEPGGISGYCGDSGDGRGSGPAGGGPTASGFGTSGGDSGIQPRGSEGVGGAGSISGYCVGRSGAALRVRAGTGDPAADRSYLRNPHNIQNSARAGDGPGADDGTGLHNIQKTLGAGGATAGGSGTGLHNIQNSAHRVGGGRSPEGAADGLHNIQNSPPDRAAGATPPPAGCAVITSPAALGDVAAAVAGADGPIGLDTETTGLDHARHRVRLLQLATPRGTFLVDVFAFPDPAAALAPVFDALAAAGVVGHNLGFDLPFLMRLGFTPGRVVDTMLASQVLHAGDLAARHGLRDVAARHLGLTLAKELQQADWAGPLTPDMLLYAALDAEVPLRAWPELAAELEAARLTAVAEIEFAALPCVAWAATRGVALDRGAWQALAATADAERARLREALDAAAPDGATLFGARNWDSPDDVKAALAAVGVELEATDDDALAAVAHPLAERIRDYRSVARLATTYGRDWLRHVAPDGRVYATWKPIGAGASGRMSCKGPNLQQLPRDARYRRCFAAPPGRVLVKADYSQIELRIAAKVARDKRMLEAYQSGEDLHTLTARALLGKAEVTKADRQLAKAVNFGLLYGQGADGLRRYARAGYGVELTAAEAVRHRETFFRTYPGLRAWHRSVGDGAVETRTLAGRRRLGVTRYTEKLNTPIQGSGADGLKRALALLWERRHQCPDAFPVLVVHDEVVVECDADKAEEAAVWLRAAMIDGMAPLVHPVPVAVEVDAGPTWGG